MQDKNGLELGTAQRGTPGKTVLVKNTTASDMATLLDTFNYKVDPIDGSTLIFSTVDSAINMFSTIGRSNLGDQVLLSPGYTETISTAGQIAMDVAGLTIKGLGNGSNRPVLTFDGANATPSVTFGAANMRIEGLVLINNEASLNHMFDIGAADDLTIHDCDFREGSATGLSFITADGSDNDCDRLTISSCRFYAPTAGNYDNAIQLAKDFTNVTIKDCEIDGDFDDAGLHVPAGGNAQVNLQILRCTVKNRLTNTPAIAINGTGSSGIIKDCLLRTDTKATALDNGSLACSNVRWADETDQVGDQPIFAEPDSAENILGANDSDNGFDSTNVTANADGSVLERLETIQQLVGGTDGSTNVLGANDADNGYSSSSVVSNRDGSILERLEAIHAAQVDDDVTNLLGYNDPDNNAESQNVVANRDGSVVERLEALMDPLGGYDPLLGFRVTKTSNMADGAGTDNLFTVTGRCLLTHLSGEVTTVIGTTTTMKLRDITNSIDLCAATTITTDAVGTMYSLTSITGNILNGTGMTPVVGSVPNMTGALPMPMMVIGNVQAALTIAHVLDGAGTGAVAWVAYFKPLTAASTFVAAA